MADALLGSRNWQRHVALLELAPGDLEPVQLAAGLGRAAPAGDALALLPGAEPGLLFRAVTVRCYFQNSGLL